MTEQVEKPEGVGVVALASDIVVAYVSNNPVPRSDLPALISNVHAMIERLRLGAAAEPQAELVPAVPPKRSVKPDHIVCLEDGKKFKSLKRHLATHHGLAPDEYRRKWGLARDYPMVAPAYAEARSTMARNIGLGRKRAAATPTPPAAEEKPRRARSARKAAAPSAGPSAKKAKKKSSRRKKADA